MKLLLATLALIASSSAFAQSTTSQTQPYVKAVAFAARGAIMQCRTQSLSQQKDRAYVDVSADDIMSAASTVEITGGQTPALKFSTFNGDKSIYGDASMKFILRVYTNVDYTQIEGMQLESQEWMDVNSGNMQKPQISKGYATVSINNCFYVMGGHYSR